MILYFVCTFLPLFLLIPGQLSPDNVPLGTTGQPRWTRSTAPTQPATAAPRSALARRNLRRSRGNAPDRSTPAEEAKNPPKISRVTKMLGSEATEAVAMTSPRTAQLLALAAAGGGDTSDLVPETNETLLRHRKVRFRPFKIGVFLRLCNTTWSDQVFNHNNRLISLQVRIIVPNLLDSQGRLIPFEDLPDRSQVSAVLLVYSMSDRRSYEEIVKWWKVRALNEWIELP